MNKQIWTEIVVNDIHIPYHNKKAINCVYQAIKLIKPDGITLNGDIGDWSTFSRHDRFHAPKCHWTDAEYYKNSMKEYQGVNSFLDELDRLAPKARKRWEDGNHENWVHDFVKESKESRDPLFNLHERLDLAGRNYEVYKYNDFMYLGRLRVTHGLYTGQHHAKKHVDMLGHSILYGHLHDIQVHSKVTPEHVSHMGFCNGCLCNMNPNYLRNKPQNWNHGFAVVHVWPNRNFQVDLIRITKGRCVVNGKELIG